MQPYDNNQYGVIGLGRMGEPHPAGPAEAHRRGRDDRKNWARAIAMMRHGLGGRPYGGPTRPSSANAGKDASEATCAGTRKRPAAERSL